MNIFQVNNKHDTLEKELKEIKDERNILTREKKELTDQIQQLTTKLEHEQTDNIPDEPSSVEV